MFLVTGVTGRAGAIVIREFARQQVPVRALVRHRTTARALNDYPTVEVVDGDMSQPRVDLSAHKAFGVEPTPFAAFARRHATEFLHRQEIQESP